MYKGHLSDITINSSMKDIEHGYSFVLGLGGGWGEIEP